MAIVITDQHRADFEAEFKAERAAGGDEFRFKPLADRWIAQGFSKSCVYRWKAAIEDDDLGTIQVLHRSRVKDADEIEAEADEIEAEAEIEPVIEEIRALVEVLPTHRPVVQVVGFGLSFQNQIQRIIKLNEDLIKYCYAQDESGRIRNPQLLIKANDQLAKVTFKLVELQAEFSVQSNINLFFEILFDELAAESPALADRVIVRLNQHKSAWGL